MHTTHTQLIMHETLTPNASAMIASELPKIQFANSDNAIAAPNWFTWGLHFGQQLAVNRSALESGLVLVTAPCESALLGAISLGTLSHLLEIQSHNHGPEQHFESLFQMPVGTLVKRKAQTNTHTRPRVYRLLANRSRENGIKMKMVKGPQKFKDCIITLTPAKALSYVPQDEDVTTPELVHSLSPFPGAAFLEQISSTIPNSQTWRNNLDQILISGPTAGNSSPKKQFIETSLVNEEGEQLGLHEMLAVKEWKSDKTHGPCYSRFLNSSVTKAEFPAVAEKANFVYYNAVDSYLRFTDRFSTQLQVLVCSRDIDSHKTERLLHKLYTFRDRAKNFNTKTTSSFEDPPFGIQVHFLGTKVMKEKKRINCVVVYEIGLFRYRRKLSFGNRRIQKSGIAWTVSLVGFPFLDGQHLVKSKLLAFLVNQ